MEDPPQHMIINTRSSQLQLEIVEDVPEKTEAPVQSTTAPPAEDVRLPIPMDDPHQDMIINSHTTKQQTTALAEGARLDTNNANDDDDDDDDDYDVIRRVPTHMRKDRSGHLYEPVMVSIGPYHNNKPQCSEMERFKKRLLKIFMEESVAMDRDKDKNFYYRKISEKIDTIRRHYHGVKNKNYTGKALTELILRDACFIVSYMKPEMAGDTIYRLFGNLTTYIHVTNDLLRVENQIPFWIINLLLLERCREDEVDKIVRTFLGEICFKDAEKLKSLPWKGESGLPLHLLEACQITLWKREIANEPAIKTDEQDHRRFLKSYNIQHRSVTYLQAKGIYVRPSSECLQDITFTSYRFFGVLRLPIFFVDNTTMVFLQNIVAFEYSTEGLQRDADLASYVTFMKSLIDTPKDVKELREREILYCTLGSDEEVVKLFKDIVTYTLSHYDTYMDVRKDINRHCSSRAKTWMADLFHNYCRSPWSVIAIFAATFVMCLTFLQTYYTVHPSAA